MKYLIAGTMLFLASLSLYGKEITLKLTGGVSGGLFLYENSMTHFLTPFKINNLLVVLSLSDENEGFTPGFVAAFGGTITPSLLESSHDFHPEPSIQYAYFTAEKDGVSFEFGILPPLSGYEDTYTFNNKNITVGIVASQQPFNAIGGRINFSKFVDLSVGFYRDRLDPEEYCLGRKCPSTTYEIVMGKRIEPFTFTLYHYHVNNIRSLTGMVFELKKDAHYFAFNTDYWKWANSNEYSVASALYYSRMVKGGFEIPLRVEYVFRNGDVYIFGPARKRIFSFTMTPTLHISDSTYLRFESGYVISRNSFVVDCKRSSSLYEFSIEIGFVKE